MKRIGEIAARLVANPIELVAAANQSAAHELGNGPTGSGGIAADPSAAAPLARVAHRLSAEGTREPIGKLGKEAGAGEALASQQGGRQTEGETAL